MRGRAPRSRACVCRWRGSLEQREVSFRRLAALVLVALAVAGCDEAWWDYRDWTHDADLPVVVGAFPEPFLHGYGGKTRPAAVLVTRPVEASNLDALVRLIHAKGTFRRVAAVPRGWNILELVPGAPRFTAHQRVTGGPWSPIVLTFAGDVGKLLAGGFARRFSVP